MRVFLLILWIVIVVAFLFAWSIAPDWQEFIRFWGILATVTGLLVAIYNQSKIQGNLGVLKAAKLDSHVELCLALVEEILNILDSDRDMDQSMYLLLKLLSRYLRYAYECCPERIKHKIDKHSREVTKMYTQSNARAKNSANRFEGATYRSEVLELRSFLISLRNG